MYKDIKRGFFWNDIKKDVAEFVSNRLICQQVKAEQKKPGGLLHPLLIPKTGSTPKGKRFVENK